MRRWVLGLWVAMGMLGWASGARACQVCNELNVCQTVPSGALGCLGNGLWCSQAGRCRSFREVGDGMIQLALLDDSPVLTSRGASRVLRGAGPVAVGRAARRIAAGGFDAGIVERFSLLGTLTGGTAVLRTPAGDGFALRRERDGRGAQVEVLAVVSGRPGRVLAREHLDSDDALVVRVAFGGRACVLVLQAATLSPAEAAARMAAAQSEIQRSMPETVDAERPPFEFELLDR